MQQQNIGEDFMAAVKDIDEYIKDPGVINKYLIFLWLIAKNITTKTLYSTEIFI